MKNKIEKLSSTEGEEGDNNNDLLLNSPQYVFKRNAKKRQGLIRLIIIATLIILIISLTCMVISKYKHHSSLKQLNSELVTSLNTLKAQETELDQQLDKLNKEKDQIERRNEKLNNDLTEYSNKNTQLMKERSQLNEQMKQLQKELALADEEGKNLYQANEDSIKRVKALEEESLKYDQDIEELKKQVTDLEHNNANNNRSTPTLMQSTFESNIATQQSEVNFIKSLFPSTWKNLQFKRIYTKKDYGINPEIFHNQCDGAEMTLVLLHLEIDLKFEQKIGGFTSRSWAMIRGVEKVKADINAFLFNLSYEQKFHVKEEMRKKAIVCDYNYLAVFNDDLKIGECGISSNFPNVYENNFEGGGTLMSGVGFLSANNIIDIEVFEVTKTD